MNREPDNLSSYAVALVLLLFTISASAQTNAPTKVCSISVRDADGNGEEDAVLKNDLMELAIGRAWRSAIEDLTGGAVVGWKFLPLGDDPVGRTVAHQAFLGHLAQDVYLVGDTSDLWPAAPGQTPAAYGAGFTGPRNPKPIVPYRVTRSGVNRDGQMAEVILSNGIIEKAYRIRNGSSLARLTYQFRNRNEQTAAPFELWLHQVVSPSQPPSRQGGMMDSVIVYRDLNGQTRRVVFDPRNRHDSYLRTASYRARSVDTYKTAYGGRGIEWWEKQPPSFVDGWDGRWLAVFNPRNGHGVSMAFDAEQTLGTYSWQGAYFTTEVMFRGVTLPPAAVWQTTVHYGQFGGLKEIASADSYLVYEKPIRLTAAGQSLRVTGRFVSLVQGKVEAFLEDANLQRESVATVEVGPTQPVELNWQGRSALKQPQAVLALRDAQNRLVAEVRPDRVDEKAEWWAFDYPSPPPADQPVVFAPEELQKTLRALQKQNAIVVYDEQASAEERQLAQAFANHFGQSLASLEQLRRDMPLGTDPYRIYCVVGTAQSPALLALVGHPRDPRDATVTPTWPGTGKGRIALIQTEERVSLFVGGSDLAGLRAAVERLTQAAPPVALPALSLWREDPMRVAHRWSRPAKGENEDRARLSLYAARGEYESAQIVLTAGKLLQQVSCTVTSLKRDDGKELPPPRIRVVSEFMIADHWKRLRRDALLDSLPSQLEPGQSVPLWLTFHVPADAKPGLYQGELRVTAGLPATAGAQAGDTRRQLPIELKVLSFSIPAQARLENMPYLFYSSIRKALGLENDDAGWRRALKDEIAPNLVAHKVNVSFDSGSQVPMTIVEGEGDQSFPAFDVKNPIPYKYGVIHKPTPQRGKLAYRFNFDLREFEEETALLLGGGIRKIMLHSHELADDLRHVFWGGPQADAGRRLGLQGRIEGMDAPTRKALLDQPYPAADEVIQAMAKAKIAALKAMCQRRGWNDIFYCEIGEEMPWTDGWWLRQTKPYRDAGIPTTCETPHVFLDELLDTLQPHIDISWPTFDQHDEYYQRAQRAGKKTWWHLLSGGGQPSMIENMPWTHPRAFVWEAWHYRVEGLAPAMGYQTGDHNTFFYPDRKTGRLIDSVRWELYREAIEDWQYLDLLQQEIERAKKQGREWQPAQAALDKAVLLAVQDPKDRFRYSRNPDHYNEARKLVATALEQILPATKP
ncbi:MAG: DUF4091 domain-containing protein [Verrucomicrobia bacterium]|nr:DUF4091 domain-containing protein [Verrucomicrobiota bacterium]